MAEQEEITIRETAIEEIIAPAEVPAAIKEKAQHLIQIYSSFLKTRTEAFRQRKAEPAVSPEMGGPMLASGYQYWNCLTMGPVQFFGNPPYRPSKIIAAGEWTLMLGVVWINPVNSDGGGLPGTVVLGARHYRVRFETVNISAVADGPDQDFAGVFASPAPVISIFPWWFLPPDPGPNPKLFETSLTADIVETGQPMAAFSTWHFDFDREPGFLGLPERPEHWQFEIPARYLVYRE
jgi:hypothetical protein